jgi:hypothetical protein
LSRFSGLTSKQDDLNTAQWSGYCTSLSLSLWEINMHLSLFCTQFCSSPFLRTRKGFS